MDGRKKKKKPYWKAYVKKAARHTKKQDITDILIKQLFPFVSVQSFVQYVLNILYSCRVVYWKNIRTQTHTFEGI